MKILSAVSEIFPFYKTGGLADVTGALMQVFSQFKNTKTVVFVPKYRLTSGCIRSLEKIPGSYKVTMSGIKKSVKLFKVKWDKVTVYFVENEEYFDRANIYGTKRAGYKDNDRRFIFFAKAVMEGAKFIGFKPNIIHCHDWQTGLIPAYLKTLYTKDSFYSKTKTLFTIHNLAYQGVFTGKAFDAAGFPPEYFTSERLEYYGGINFLKSGIVYADAINTVSPTYAEEALQNPQISYGINGDLNLRTKDFCGILNGIDTKIWNPRTDTLIAATYGKKDFKKGKNISKLILQKKHNLTRNQNLPLIGIVSRLDYQKGLDVAAKIIPYFAGRCQFAVLGLGSRELEEKFKTLAKEFRGSLFFVPKLDETLAHNIYAGSDIFLMPSRFEPCGLSQMIALKYGTPVVTAKTGGLADTISGFGESKNPNGFFTHILTENALADTLNSAMLCYGNKTLWYNIIKNAMKTDFSWKISAKKYLSIFNKLTKKRG